MLPKDHGGPGGGSRGLKPGPVGNSTAKEHLTGLSLSGLSLSFCLSTPHSLCPHTHVHTHTFLGSALRNDPLTLDHSRGPRRNTSPFVGQNTDRG